MEDVSITSRGIISEIPSGISWYDPFAVRTVSVIVSSQSGILPREYKNVPWPYREGVEDWANGIPNVGSYVTLGYRGGNSEYPFIISYYPGSSSIEEAAGAIFQRGSVPNEIVHGALTGIPVAQDVFDVMTLVHQQIVGKSSILNTLFPFEYTVQKDTPK